MTVTLNNNFQKMASGLIDVIANINDFMDKVEDGRTIKLTTGEAIEAYRGIYIKSDGLAWKSKLTQRMFAINKLGTTVASGSDGYFQYTGTIINGSWTWSNEGVLLYLDSNSDLTETKPSVDLGAVAITKSTTEIILLPPDNPKRAALKQTATTVTLTEFHDYIEVDASANAVTITLPDANTMLGKKYYFMAADATSNIAKIVTDGSDSFNSTGNKTLTFDNDESACILVASSATVWAIVSSIAMTQSA